MAKCEKREIPQPKHEYVLTLTGREAYALRALLGKNVGGDDLGPRSATSAICHALTNAGVKIGHCFTGMAIGLNEWPPEAPNA